MIAVALRCERHLHGIAVGDVIEVRCRECAKRLGVAEVIHRWRIGADGAVLLEDGDAGPAESSPVDNGASSLLGLVH